MDTSIESENVVEDLKSLLNNSNISNSFEEYKKTDEYKSYFDMIRLENSGMTDYLIDLCLFGFFHETHLKDTNGSILEMEHKLIPPIKGDLKGMIHSFDSMEHYLAENPDIKEIKLVGQPLKLEEVKELKPEIEEKSENEII